MTHSTRPTAAFYKHVLGLAIVGLLGVFAVDLMAGPGGLLHPREISAAPAPAVLPAAMLAGRAVAVVTTTVAPVTARTVASAVTTTTVAPVTARTVASAATTTAPVQTTTTSTSPPTTVPVPKPPVPVPLAATTAGSESSAGRAPSPAPTTVQAPATPAIAVAPVVPHTLADPAASISPSAQMQGDCFGTSDLAACNRDSLAAINQARAAEGLGGLQLPSDFYSLAVNSQMLAVINSERTSRGLPAFSYNVAYEPAAQTGAETSTDPTGPSGLQWASIVATSFPTALAADYSWMYDDGTNSPNVDCTATNSSGCWGHRNAILSPWPGWAAVGSAVVAGWLNLTAVFVSA